MNSQEINERFLDAQINPVGGFAIDSPVGVGARPELLERVVASEHPAV